MRPLLAQPGAAWRSLHLARAVGRTAGPSRHGRHPRVKAGHSVWRSRCRGSSQGRTAVRRPNDDPNRGLEPLCGLAATWMVVGMVGSGGSSWFNNSENQADEGLSAAAAAAALLWRREKLGRGRGGRKPAPPAPPGSRGRPPLSPVALSHRLAATDCHGLKRLDVDAG